MLTFKFCRSFEMIGTSINKKNNKNNKNNIEKSKKNKKQNII